MKMSDLSFFKLTSHDIWLLFTMSCDQQYTITLLTDLMQGGPMITIMYSQLECFQTCLQVCWPKPLIKPFD